MGEQSKGKLIIIGGHEDKTGDQAILKEICKDAVEKKGSLLILTVATQKPKEVAEEYTRVFKKLGVTQIDTLDIRERREAEDEAAVKKVAGAAVVFFTGGDQLRITSQIGDSGVFQMLTRVLEDGCTVAGTSAGAAAMPETMIVGGPGDETNEISSISMAPGLALIRGVVVDSHFAERGRMGRLLGVVAQNPRNLGLGIDEDTAIVVEDDDNFRVVGNGAVYVTDGMEISYSSLSEKEPEGIISIFDVRVHVLREGDHFDLTKRRPFMMAEKQEKA